MQHLNAQVNLSYAILIFVKIPDFFGLWLKLEEVPTKWFCDSWLYSYIDLSVIAQSRCVYFSGFCSVLLMQWNDAKKI